MGGVWERFVRSMKKILSVLLSEKLVGDESLFTVVAEAESTLNSRPLTQNPDDPTAFLEELLKDLLQNSE